MSENKQKTTLEKVVARLPDDVQEYLVSGQFQSEIKEISERYALDKEQGRRFEEEILFTLMGLEDLEDISSNLTDVIPENENRRLIVNDAVVALEPFIQSLEKIKAEISDNNEEESLKNEVPTPPPKPAPLVYKDENTVKDENSDRTRKKGLQKERSNIRKAIETSNDRRETLGDSDKDADEKK